MITRECTGAADIHGQPICEGDEVWLYAQDYEKTLENPEEEIIGQIPIYTVDEAKPLPIADVPLARGIVEWDSRLLAYMIRYTWKCQQWGKDSAGCYMGGGCFAFEISKSSHL